MAQQVVTELVIDANTSGADQFSQSMDRASASAEKGVGSVAGLTLAVAGVGVAFIGSLAALRGFVDYVGNTNKELVDLAINAEKAGMTTKSFQETLFAAKASGLTDKDFISGLDKIGADLQAASRGATDFGKLFEVNGVSVKQLNGDLKTTQQAMGDISNLIKNAPTLQMANAIASIVGLSRDWVPFLRQGVEASESQKRAAADLGVTIDDATIQKAKDFNAQWRTAIATWDLQFKASLAGILPLLTQLATLASKLIDGVGSISGSVSLWTTPDENKSKQQLNDQADYVHTLIDLQTRFANSSGTFAGAKINNLQRLLGIPEGSGIEQATAYLDKLSALYDKAATRLTVTPAGNGSTVLPPTGGDVNDAVDRAIITLQRHLEVQKADTLAVGLGDAALARFRAEAAETAAMQANGGKITAGQAADFEKLKVAAYDAADALARAKVASQIDFARQTAFLSPQDVAIAQQLKGIYGNDVPAALASSEAAAIRFNDTLKSISDLARSSATTFANDFVQGLLSGKSAMESLHNAAQNLEKTLASKAITDLFSGNFVQAGIEGIAAIGAAIVGNNTKSSDAYWKQMAEATAQRVQQYQDRLTAAQVDTTTRAGAILAQDRQFEAERIAENKAGGLAMNQLLQTELAERQKLQSDFNAKDIAAAKAKQDAIDARQMSASDRIFAAGNDTSTLAGALAAADRQFIKERADEMKAGGEAINDLVAAQEAERLGIYKSFNDALIADAKRAADTIKAYLESLQFGANSILSPQDQLAAAQGNFSRQLGLAQGGDAAAQGSITSYASTLLDQAKSYYASSSGYADIYRAVTSALDGLVSGVSAPSINASPQPVSGGVLSGIIPAVSAPRGGASNDNGAYFATQTQTIVQALASVGTAEIQALKDEMALLRAQNERLINAVQDRSRATRPSERAAA